MRAAAPGPAAWEAISDAQVTFRARRGFVARRRSADPCSARRACARAQGALTRLGASTSKAATCRSGPATISTATPTTPGSARNPIPADRTSWGLWTVLGEESSGSFAPSSKTPARQRPDQPAGRRLLREPIWTRPGSRRAAPRRSALISTGSPRSRNRDELMRLFATPGYPSPIGIGIIPDPADPTRYIAFASQAGLGMPNRDYYLREGEQYERYRAAYRDYVVTMHAARRHRGCPRRRPTRSSRSNGASPRRIGRPSAAATSSRSTIR